MKSVSPLILIGPSGAGKSTVAHALEQTGNFVIIRSYTTRPRRIDEDNTTHSFVGDEEFDEREARGEFIGTVELFQRRYALPHFADSAKRPIFILRAPFVPLALKHYPDSFIVQLEAPVAMLVNRIKARKDAPRVDQENFAHEIALGRSCSHYHLDTSLPLDECIKQLTEELR